MPVVIDWKKVACILAGMVAVHRGEEAERVLEKAISATEIADDED